jgi:hypothetical protein
MPRKCERVCLVQGPFAVAPRWGAGASIHSMGLLPLQFGASHLAFSASRCLGLELTSVKTPFTQPKKPESSDSNKQIPCRTTEQC